MAGTTTTAAPRTAMAEIKITDGDTGKPLPDAAIEIHSVVTATGDATGVWKSKQAFAVGSYDVKIWVSGFGPEPPPGLPRAEWTWIKNVSFKTGVTKVDVKLYQALPRASVHVLNAIDKKPVRGALVFVDATTPGKTDIYGVALTKAARPGLHPVTARKPGWGWVGATKTADAVKNIDFSGSKDIAVQIMMEPVWGKVRSSKITVKGRPFVDWFNQDFIPRYPKAHATIKYPGTTAALIFPHGVSTPAFDNIFNHCDQIWAPEMTIEEFIAIFLIMYNESGFVPQMEADYLHNELKAMKYMFGTDGGNKSSYNVPKNHLAGNQLTDPKEVPCQLLTAAGITLTQKEKDTWNGKVWPATDPGPELFAALKECDFYKFRGRGLIQITWRVNFETCADPHLVKAGFAKSNDLTEAALAKAIKTNPDVYRPMVGSFLKTCGPWGGVNAQNWAPFGTALSGGGNYGKIYEYRCKELIAAMQKEEVVLA